MLFNKNKNKPLYKRPWVVGYVIGAVIFTVLSFFHPFIGHLSVWPAVLPVIVWSLILWLIFFTFFYLFFGLFKTKKSLKEGVVISLVLYFLAFFCLVLFPQSIFGYISLLFILPGALATAVTIPSALYFIFVPIAGIQNYIFDFLPIQELMVSPSSNPINMFIMVGLLSSIIINVPLWAMIIGGLVDFVKKHKKNV